MVVHDWDYTFAWSAEEAKRMAKRIHTGARSYKVETITKSILTGTNPKPGKYKIHSYY